MKTEVEAESGGQAAGRDIVHKERSVIHVNFGANHGGQQFIANEAVYIHMAPASPRPKVKVVIQPGPDCIDEEQKNRLKALVAEVVRLEGLVRRTPRSFSSVWVGVNAKAKATSYHLITQANFPRAEKFLREWIGRLSSAKSAHLKDSNWRNRKFSYIFANVKQLAAEQTLRARLIERFGCESMKDLSDADLESVYQWVAGWKKTGHAPGQASPDRVPEGT